MALALYIAWFCLGIGGGVTSDIMYRLRPGRRFSCLTSGLLYVYHGIMTLYNW